MHPASIHLREDRMTTSERADFLQDGTINLDTHVNEHFPTERHDFHAHMAAAFVASPKKNGAFPLLREKRRYPTNAV